MKLNIKALSRSTSLTIILIAVLTTYRELSKPFKELLASITGHHWVTKSVLSVAFFILVYFLLSKQDSVDVGRESLYVVWATVLSGLVISVFYVWHFFA